MHRCDLRRGKLRRETAIRVSEWSNILDTAMLPLVCARQGHLGILKAKLAKLRTQLLEPTGPTKQAGEGFDVVKYGDARIAIIGFPSVGKSTALALCECHSPTTLIDAKPSLFGQEQFESSAPERDGIPPPSPPDSDGDRK